MKKLTAFLLAIVFAAWMMPAVGHADNATTLYLNGTRLNPEVPPQLIDGNAMVPVRVIAEKLGAKVDWNDQDRSVFVQKAEEQLMMKVNNPEASVNGKTVRLDAAPTIVDGSAMLPVRFVAENLGLEVTWDDLTHSVLLFEPANARSGLDQTQGSGTGASGQQQSHDGTQTTGDQQTGSGSPEPGFTAAPTPTPEAGKTGTNPTAPQGNETTTAEPTPAASDKPSSGTTTTPTPAPSGSTVGGTGGSDTANTYAKTDLQTIMVTNDTIVLQAGTPLKPNVFKLSNPDRLVIDLPGVTIGSKLNGNDTLRKGEIPLQSHPSVLGVRYALFSSDPNIVRIVVDLKKKIEYNLIESGSPNIAVLKIKTPLYKVVLDAGHGDHDTGAISVTGRPEKDFTLAMVTKIAHLLESEPAIQVIETRSDDTFLELQERVDIANKQGANLFISIHGNKFTKSTAAGTETYYDRDESRGLADVLHSHILQANGFPDRKVRQYPYYVIKHTTMPAVLCEIGFLSNPEEEAQMFDGKFQDKVAASIVAGIKEYLHIQ